MDLLDVFILLFHLCGFTGCVHLCVMINSLFVHD